MKPGVVAAIVLLALVVGVVLGSLIGGGEEVATDRVGDRGKAEKLALEEEVARLRTDLAEARKAAEQPAPEEAADPTAEAEGESADSEEAEEEKVDPAAAPRFFAQEYNGILREVDWGTIGTNLREMTKLIPQILDAVARREEPVMEHVGRVQELNGPLLMAALKVQKELPGDTVNEGFTSPAFMVNAIASTLEAAGSPLTPEQARGLEATARAWMARDAQREDGYAEGTYELKKLFEEAELKEGFFRDAFAALSAEQGEILSPAAVRGRVRADLFSAGLIYAGRAGVLAFANQEELVNGYLAAVTRQLRLTEPQREQARKTLAAWAASIPADMLQQENSPLDFEGLLPVGRVNALAKQELVLLKSLAAEVDLEEGQLGSVRGAGYVLVALRRGPSDD